MAVEVELLVLTATARSLCAFVAPSSSPTSGSAVPSFSTRPATGARPRPEGLPCEISVSFFPGQDFAAAEAWLLEAARANPSGLLRSKLAERLPASLAEALWPGRARPATRGSVD